jgi:hypothetical protein
MKWKSKAARFIALKASFLKADSSSGKPPDFRLPSLTMHSTLRALFAAPNGRHISTESTLATIKSHACEKETSAQSSGKTRKESQRQVSSQKADKASQASAEAQTKS